MKQLSGGDKPGGMAQNLQGMPHQFFLVDIGIKQGCQNFIGTGHFFLVKIGATNIKIFGVYCNRIHI